MKTLSASFETAGETVLALWKEREREREEDSLSSWKRLGRITHLIEEKLERFSRETEIGESQVCGERLGRSLGESLEPFISWEREQKCSSSYLRKY